MPSVDITLSGFFSAAIFLDGEVLLEQSAKKKKENSTRAKKQILTSLSIFITEWFLLV
jgi:hypothetical protein